MTVDQGGTRICWAFDKGNQEILRVHHLGGEPSFFSNTHDKYEKGSKIPFLHVLQGVLSRIIMLKGASFNFQCHGEGAVFNFQGYGGGPCCIFDVGLGRSLAPGHRFWTALYRISLIDNHNVSAIHQGIKV